MGHFITETFGDNKYTKWYLNIISNALIRNSIKITGIESHHIIPKCLGGSNALENLVNLTIKEHYICHLCLLFASKSVYNKHIYFQQVLSVGAFIMGRKGKWVMPSFKVIKIRKLLSETKKGRSSRRKGIPLTKETKQKMKDNHWTKRGYKHGMLGRTHSKESIQKLIDNRSKFWFKIISPAGEIYISNNKSALCRDHQLSMDFFTKFTNSGKPIPFPVEHKMNQVKQPRINIAGWTIYCQTEPYLI
jgi:hypothetical protein